MYIKKIVIENYKCFYEPTPIKFLPGFNIIIGKNNSGKTALVEILSLQKANNPHFSLKIPKDSPKFKQQSTVKFVLGVHKKDFNKIVFLNNKNFHVPKNGLIPRDFNLTEVNNLFKDDLIFIDILRTNTSSISHFTNYGSIKSSQAIQVDRGLKAVHETPYHPKKDGAFLVQEAFHNRIYHFRAERFHVGQESEKTFGETLNPDASNLPSVLDTLMSEKKQIFEDYLKEVHTVFPSIHDISVRLIKNEKTIKIFLTMINREERRYDLDIPLQDSGTGIGQVLAILYVVVTSKNPQIFVIDEPQSFLHPGAIRRLFNLLQKKYHQHQFILTTHSPAVISAANPNNIIQLIKENESTTAINIDIKETNQMKAVLSDVGARLSDVFGADNILWVEGKTEEECFPVIVRKLCESNLLGTVILGINNTGDFETKKRKDAENTIKIYEKLSTSSALIPPAICFILDKEGRSEPDLKELRKRSDKIKFISPKMFENYLINADAISKHMNTLIDFSPEKITSEEIISWLDDNRWNDDFFDNNIEEDKRKIEVWFETAHGADLLDEMYKGLSDGRYNYSEYKPTYGLFLTEYIIDNTPKDFEELVDFIDEILNSERKNL